MSISTEDRATLLAIARQTIEHTVAGGPPASLDAAEGVLAEKRGCFVTLTNASRLRGCIGTFQPRLPLGESIIEMAAMASQDSRFLADPVTGAELPHLHVEVSVLSPLEKIDDPLSLEIGVHGIYILRGHAGGCFLPEVATDQGWNAEQFLSHCCAGKAGMNADAWRYADTQVYVFTSEKFGEQ